MYFIHFKNDYFKNTEPNSLDKSQKKKKTLFILLTFMFSESDDHPRKNVISIYSHTRFFKSSKINFIKEVERAPRTRVDWISLLTHSHCDQQNF